MALGSFVSEFAKSNGMESLHIWTGLVNESLPFIQQFDTDGTVVYRSERSFIIGAATVEGTQLCLRFEADFLGHKNCGYVYRNRDGAAATQNEYVYVNASALWYFWLVGALQKEASAMIAEMATAEISRH